MPRQLLSPALCPADSCAPSRHLPAERTHVASAKTWPNRPARNRDPPARPRTGRGRPSRTACGRAPRRASARGRGTLLRLRSLRTLPGHIAVRSRQWLGVVPAAGVRAARRSLPLAVTVGRPKSPGERRTAPGPAARHPPPGSGGGPDETPGAGDAESAPGLAGGARERGVSSHRRCGQDQYAIVPENRSVSASVTPTLPAPVACANRPVPPVACQKIATSSMTSGFGHG